MPCLILSPKAITIPVLEIFYFHNSALDSHVRSISSPQDLVEILLCGKCLFLSQHSFSFWFVGL